MARKIRQKTTTLRYPYSQEIKYTRALLSMVREFKRQVKMHLISLLPKLIDSATPEPIFIQDAPDDWAEQINEAVAKITKNMKKPIQITEEQMAEVGYGTNTFNKKEWQRLIRDAYGVNPTAENPDLYADKLNEWATKNSKLITDIPTKSMKQIKEETIKALQSGTSTADLSATIMERINVSESRAELIARDQVAKLNADLNQSRQEDAGVNQYIWRTVGDERVRDSHDDCDGETFDWDGSVSLTGGVTKPDGCNPGEDIQCRCWAEPILPATMNVEVELEDA